MVKTIDVEALRKLAGVGSVTAEIRHVSGEEEAITITWHDGDKRVGSFAFSIDRDGTAWVAGMGLDGDYRQKGIYTNLCAKFPAWARENGLQRMNIIAVDTAAEIFEKTAFEPGEFEGQFTLDFSGDKSERYAASKEG